MTNDAFPQVQTISSVNLFSLEAMDMRQGLSINPFLAFQINRMGKVMETVFQQLSITNDTLFCTVRRAVELADWRGTVCVSSMNVHGSCSLEREITQNEPTTPFHVARGPWAVSPHGKFRSGKKVRLENVIFQLRLVVLRNYSFKFVRSWNWNLGPFNFAEKVWK